MSSSPGGDALAVRILFAFHMYMALQKKNAEATVSRLRVLS